MDYLIGLVHEPIKMFVISSVTPKGTTKMADNLAKCKLSNSLFYFVGKREQLICYGITISL